MPTIGPKPSKSFVSEFNKFKANGLNEKEVTKLISTAQKDIAKSAEPKKAAAMYTKEVRGWINKGLAEANGTPEMAGWLFRNTADAKLINDGSKSLKGQAAALTAKHPSLKTLDFKSIQMGSEGDYNYMIMKDTKGAELSNTDPRVKLLKRELGPAYKAIMVGNPDLHA